jgi:hypothetical protein
MSVLKGFKGNDASGIANLRMDNGDPILIRVGQSGVLVRKSRIGMFGPKLYESVDSDDAAKTAMSLGHLFSNNLTPDGMANPVLRAFTNAVLHCSTPEEVMYVLNEKVIHPAG